MALKIKRWDPVHNKLEDVPTDQLPLYAREGLYAEDAGRRHFWIYQGPDPVPSGTEIKNRIQHEVPH